MAKIIKITPSNLTKSVNLIKTARNSTTNPFKYSNFEGNTLQFADVFEGFEPKSINKMKMIASSVAGSMNRLRKGITEPITKFITGLKHGISSAWDYAVNTEITDVPVIGKAIEIANTPITMPKLPDIGGTISKSFNGMKGKISDGLGSMNAGIVNLGKGINSHLDIIASKLGKKSIPSGLSVAELENLWKQELTSVETGGIA